MKAIYALIIWSSIIVIVSIIPISENQMSFFKHEDKLAHILLYATQCILLIACLNKYQNRKYLFAISATIIFGIVMEIFQSVLNTGRHFDYFDIIANISGSFVGSFLIYCLPKNIQNE